MQRRRLFGILVLLLWGCDDGSGSAAEDILGEETRIEDSSTAVDTREPDLVDTAEPDLGPPLPNCGTERCTGAQTCCGNTCVDVSADAEHCGGCGQACDAAAECVSGACVCGGISCADDEACCGLSGGPSCVAIEENPAHCGACGNACGDNQICQGGLCLCEDAGGTYEQCRAGESCCPGLGCRALGSDANSCGTCGLVCNPGELCDLGVCACGDVRGASAPACGTGEACCGETPTCVAEDDPVCTCGSGRCLPGELCCAVDIDGVVEDRCLDVASDSDHCGTCGAACGPSELCLGGQCECEGGFGDCDGDLSNGCEAKLATDANHCGVCGSACAPGELCDGLGRCRTTCQAGATQCGSTCVWLDRTPEECGGCGLSCGSGEVCSAGLCATSCQQGLSNCGGSCVDLEDDRFNCGGCGLDCPPGEVCSGGQCTLSCETGLTNCGGTCVNLAQDEANCSQCGLTCGAGFECRGGQCVLTCQEGLEKCDETCVDLNTSRNHCGECGQRCPSGNVCDGTGSCSLSCQAGLVNCFGVCVDLTDSNANCGACGNACGTNRACRNGSCELVCPGSLEKCNTTCVDTTTDRRHCGACGTVCGNGEVCEAGVCTLSCASPTVACGGSCVDVRSDPQHCGACEQACGSGEVCLDGICATTCPSPFVECSGACVVLDTDPLHCGACDAACDLPNSVEGCVGGACFLARCEAGFDNCDRDPSNGCEQDVVNDPGHCGRCNQTCDGLANTTGGTCNAGTCEIASCDTDFDSCDGDPLTGCESNIATDLAHCGGCGTPCVFDNATATCAAGACAFDGCLEGFADCDVDLSNGCEAELATDVAHCGACGVVCGAGAVCNAGVCECTAGGEGCLASGDSHASASCSGADCVLGCDADRGDCDGDSSNSCETDLLTDWAHCGTCGTDCTVSNQGCVAGVCSDVLASCNAWRQAGQTTSGVYTIDPDGAGAGQPFDAYCDMVTDGGGWTLLGVVSGADANNWNTQYGYWSDSATLGVPTDIDSDYKSPAWLDLDISGSTVLLERQHDGVIEAQSVLSNTCLKGESRFVALFAANDITLACVPDDITVLQGSATGVASVTYEEDVGDYGLSGAGTNGFCWNGGDIQNNIFDGHIMWNQYPGTNHCRAGGHLGGIGVYFAGDPQYTTSDITGTNWLNGTDYTKTVIRFYAR